MQGRVRQGNQFGRAIVAALVTASLIAPGCVKQPKKDAFIEHWDVQTSKSQGYSPSPHPRKIEFSKVAISSKKEEKAAPKPERKLPQQRLTLRMYDTDLVAVVRAMARAANQNVVLSSSIPGSTGTGHEQGKTTLKINVNVTDAPWDETFKSILSSNGLTYTIDGDIIQVMTLLDLEQQNKLKEADNKRAVEAVKSKELEPYVMATVEINYAELAKIYATLSAMCGASATPLPGSDNKQAVPAGQTPRDITPTSATDDSLKLNAPGARRPGQLNCSVVADQHSNSVIIQGPSADTEKLVALIEELDKPRPQIKLKAFIVQTDRSTAQQLGMQWGGKLKGNNFQLTPAQTGTSTTSSTTGNTGTSSSTASGSGTQTNSPTWNSSGTGTSTTANATGTNTSTSTGTSTDAWSQAVALAQTLAGGGTSSNSNTGTSSTSNTSTPIFPGGTSGQGFATNFPSLTNTLTTASGLGAAGSGLNFLFGKIGENVLEAQLTALAEENKVKILSSPTITTMENMSAFVENGKDVPYVSTSQNGTNVQFAHATLKLEMLPHVVDGSNLRMKVVVKDDQVDTQNTVQGNPYIYKRETQSNLVVEDGDTIVISGLTRDTVTDNESGVPFLRDIPGIGWAFKTKGASVEREQIIIFVTPTILQEKPVAPVPPMADHVIPKAGGREPMATAEVMKP